MRRRTWVMQTRRRQHPPKKTMLFALSSAERSGAPLGGHRRWPGPPLPPPRRGRRTGPVPLRGAAALVGRVGFVLCIVGVKGVCELVDALEDGLRGVGDRGGVAV